MVLFKDKKECCGCGACSLVCPRSAIKMFPDVEGFLYPVIDDTVCINCHLCKKTCAFQNGYDISRNMETPLVYAVKHKDPNEVLNSQSGGMFAAISDYILENGGVVYGAGYDKDFRVMHKRAIDYEQRNEFRYSKYVQSDLNDTFLRVKEDLQNGYMVLYSGTPCQIAGLVSFLKNVNTEKLFLCDIICYGVPSPFIWRDYLKYIEKKYHNKIEKTYFRDKHMGWSSYYESFLLKRGGRKVIRNTYNGLFFGNLITRPSCSVCKFTNMKRTSDITIGDFWAIKKLSKDFDPDGKGVSLTLVNTVKGKELFDCIKSKVSFLKADVASCMQPRLECPTDMSSERDIFWSDYCKYGFIYVGKKYGDFGIKSFIAKTLKKFNII